MEPHACQHVFHASLLETRCRIPNIVSEYKIGSKTIELCGFCETTCKIYQRNYRIAIHKCESSYHAKLNPNQYYKYPETIVFQKNGSNHMCFTCLRHYIKN